MFGEAHRTPQDVQFHILGIPCRIHPYFWLAGLFYAWPRNPNLPGDRMLALLIVGISCLFISILIHELGHALVIRWAGFRPDVVLHAFGGYASYVPHRRISAAVSVAISLAGPLAGFLLYGLVVLIERWAETAYQHQIPFLMRVAFSHLEWINLYWGMVNLLPVYPLDGGQVSRALLQSRMGLAGYRLSLTISIITAGATAVYMNQIVGYPLFSMPVILFALLCVESIQESQGMIDRRGW